MRIAIYGLILGLSVSLSSFGKSLVDSEQCKKLAFDYSVVAFSPDTNGLLYKSYDLTSGDGLKYIKETRTAIKDKMESFCKERPNDTAIEDFQEKFYLVCSAECQDQSSIFKKPLIGESKKRIESDGACLSVCNKTNDKIKAYIDGINLGKKLAEKQVSDCSGAVASDKRSINKTKNVDTISEKIQSSTLSK